MGYGTQPSSSPTFVVSLTHSSSCDIAKDSFQSAWESIKDAFADDQKALDIIGRKTTIEDIQATIASIKESYDERPGRWQATRDILRAVSERVIYYGNIFDILAQHHPEYVSLAWGTLKFVLTVKMTAIIRKGCTDITKRASSIMLRSWRNSLRP